MFGSIGWDTFVKMIGNLMEGTLVTLEVFALTLVIALPLGLLVALGRMSKRKLISEPVKLYILVMRGTPLMLQIMFIYFAPSNILGLNIDRFLAAIIAFSINYAAYFAEIYRGGIASMEREQYEAASVLGFTKVQTFFKIILPQAIKRILPATSNEVITLVKDTVLVQVIGISELFRFAQNSANRHFSTTPLLIAGIFYLIMNWVVTKIFHAIESKLNYYR
ncbi:amino acid ABC transporter permease [Clostridium thermarum]|uniref:amino acid ABC transporter permease n=1 Tax=Clostridium thermarum TaxID=1716543 RepID=UPI0011200C43|nr:amino acid ABC transporter permease [Clostridium thermarum]